MVSKNSINAIAPILLVAAAITVGSARAVDGSVNASVVLPLTLTESSTLEFGQLSASGDVGTVVVDAENGRTATGGVTLEGGGAQPGNWSVAGEPSAVYTITLPALDITLASGIDSMTVNAFTDSKNGSSTMDGTGNDEFRVGATLTVGADQPAGSYSGSYTVTVAYQ